MKFWPADKSTASTTAAFCDLYVLSRPLWLLETHEHHGPRIDRHEMLHLHQLEAYLNSPSVNTTALKAGYTLLTAPANHVALYFMLTEEEHATFDEIGYASLAGALRARQYDKINLFYTRAEALAYYMFMISSERVYTENLQRAYLVRYYISSDNLMHYWSFFVRNWISPTYYLDANEVYNLPACEIEFVIAYRMDFDTALEPLRRFTWTDGKAWDLRQLIGMTLSTPTEPVSATNKRRTHDAAVMALRHIAGYYGLALLNGSCGPTEPVRCLGH